MQFTISALVSLLGLAGSVLAADNNAEVFSYANQACSGAVTVSAYFLSNFSQISCASTFGAGSTVVFGRGCKTYYYSDGLCKNNVFGNGNTVPNSDCRTNVGSFQVQC